MTERKTSRFMLRAKNVGRDISDEGWDGIEPIHIQAYRDVGLTFNGTSYNIGDSQFSFTIDFEAAINRLSQRLGLLSRWYKQRDESALFEFEHGDVSIPVEISERDESGKLHSRAGDLVEYLVFEIFQVINLSAPGSCDFEDCILQSVPPEKDIYGNEITRKIGLSGRHFEASLYENREYEWLRVGNIPILDVFTWMRRVMPPFTIRPRNPAAKALFGLQHLALAPPGPAAIVWVFYSLESLFQCRPGQNFSALVERIALLLELDEKAAKQLRKKIRTLYDLRSSFVHGGHQVSHPIWNGIHDDEDDEGPYQYIRECDFGAALILVCVQRLILLGWPFPMFSEVVGAGEW